MSQLYYGDNLDRMRRMNLKSVDLIYLDPPFNSNQNYNLMYKTLTGKPVPEQAEAFCDTWEMDAEKERLSRAMPVFLREHGIDDSMVQFWRFWTEALRNTQPRLLAYLIYMVERLVYMKTILKPTGSIYLHCDPAASHYIKIMMDSIFGHRNFRNEIIWRRTNSHNKISKQYGPIHDVILFYSASDDFYFNPGFTSYTKAYIKDRFTHVDANGRYQTNYLTGPGERKGESGQPWKGFNPTNNGRHWAIPKSLRKFLPQDRHYATMECLDLLYEQDLIVFPKKDGGQPMYKQYIGEGIPYQDIWAYQPNSKGVLLDESICIDEDVKYLENNDERLGYPTQKPIGLLKRIITSSSKPGDTVFDPFCGCGTTVYAAQETGREWIGCDIAILAINLIKENLHKRYSLSAGLNYEVDGIPVSVEGAKELFKSSPFQFQHWAVERVGGFPGLKKTADLGIDGRIYFEANKELKSIVLSVKGGNIRPSDIRELRGVLEREVDAEIAGFITLHEPTKAMCDEAARAGTYEYSGVFYPRIQILTIADIVEGKAAFYSPSKIGSRVATGQAVLPFTP